MKTKGKIAGIGLVTFPIFKAGNIPLSNLSTIICSFAQKVFIITGMEGTISSEIKYSFVSIYRVNHKTNTLTIKRIFGYILTQLKISFWIFRLSPQVKLWIFFIGGEGLLLPMLVARLMGKKTILNPAGIAVNVARVNKDSLLNYLMLLTRIVFALSSKIVIYSKKLVMDLGIQNYLHKTSIASEHFLDLNSFIIQKEFSQRNLKIGFIGRLSQEKGVLNYLQAILMIINMKNIIFEKQDKELNFFIGGDGELRKDVEQIINIGRISKRLQFVGWIPHDDLPKYLNQLKLLVIPSYTEGLPNIMLEAMACGTPVLATAVGAIPDIIKDGETGFILEDNSPETIAKGIIRALNHPNLEQVAANARTLVEREYTFEAAVERYRKIFEELLGKKRV